MLPPMTLYAEDSATTAAERGRYGFRRCVTEVVAGVPISRYVAGAGITELRRSGMHLVGLCPFHQERTPSFTVFGDSSYYCFGCGQWGDVVSLHARLNGYAKQWVALVELAQRYNIELPERPKLWHAWQDEKQVRREMLRKALTASYQRRLFRDYIANIQNLDERREEAALFWDDLHPVALRCAVERMAR